MLCKQCIIRELIARPGKCEECGDKTSSISLKLCPNCSSAVSQCQRCRKDIELACSSATQSGIFFVRKAKKDNRCAVILKIGEELHITLPADKYNSWSVDECSNTLDLEDASKLEGDPGMSTMTMTLKFSAVKSGQGNIKLILGSKTWECTITVK